MTVCGSCGHENRAGARFCDNCGTALGAAAAGPGVGAAGTAPLGGHTPEHLARRILKERGAIQGERRIVTVLFSDAVGSTSMGERLDAEHVYAIVQQCVSRMMDAVHRYEGAITQFRGDGVMALFGAPIAHEDSAVRAVLAGLDMQRGLAEYADEVRGRYGVELAFRVGVHTGPVVVGTISDDLSMDYTAIGDTANLAARMEGMADPGSVFMTEDTFRQVEGYIECQALGLRAAKGKAEPVAVYKALSARQGRSRLEVAAARGLAPFVGRSAELEKLLALFAEARGGRGRAALLSGDPGIGKSRLLRELRLAVASGGAWLEGRCASMGRTSPYLPIIEIVRRSLGIDERAEAEDVAGRVEGPGAAFLKFLLRIETGDAGVDRLDPVERQFGVHDAVWDLLRTRAGERPLVVVVEDLHWIDEQSERVLAQIVKRLAEAPILLVLTSRPGYTPPFADALDAIALSRLPERDSAEIALATLHATTMPPEIERLILAKAEGNPFFVEEVTRSLVEGGVLRRDGDRLVLGQPIHSVRIPVTVQDVILARIDRLAKEAKDALQLASIIGREFTVRLLDRIAEARERLSSLLGDLENLEFVFGTAVAPEAAYMFKHALTHEVAYSTLLVERRKRLHAAVGTAIEQLYADRLDEIAGMLAHHYQAAEDWPRAFTWLVRAGSRAAADCANRTALDFFDRALAAAERIGSAAAPAELAAALRGRGLARFVLGDSTSAAVDFERLRDVARACGDRELEGTALIYSGAMHIYGGRGGVAEETFRAALVVAGDGLPGLRGAAHALLAMLLLRAGPERQPEGDASLAEAASLVDRIRDPMGRAYTAIVSIVRAGWQGRFDDAVRAADRLGGAVDQDGMAAFKTQLRWARALARAGRGDYRVAVADLEAALSVCERHGDALAMGRILNTLGWIHHDLQDHERAIALCRRCLEVTAARDPEVAGNARLNLADALLATGRPEEADDVYEQVEQHVRHAVGHERRMIWRYGQHLFVSRGALCLERGDSDRAAGYAAECLDLAERSGSRKYIAAARRLHALVLSAKGNRADAAREIEAALDLARAVANPPQLWVTLAASAQIRQAAADAAGARAARTEAATLVESIAGGLGAAEAATLRSSRMAELVR